MNSTVLGLLAIFAMFVGMIVVLEAGRQLGARRLAKEPESAKAGTGAIEGAVFGLMALLIAFTFSSATSRFDTLTVYAMLVLLVLAGSLLAGFSQASGKTHNWFHNIAFALIMALAIYVILDFEIPRVGLIRLNFFDQALVDVRQSMNP